MAKVTLPNGDITRRMADSFRGRAVLKGRGDTTYMAAWPRPDSPSVKEKKRQWFEHFGCINRALKSPHPRVLDEATRQTKDTGWYYRDLLYRAAINAVVRMDGALKVNVPTVSVYDLTNQQLTNNIDTLITGYSVAWDNAEFYSASFPSRLYVRTPGLYLVQAGVNWSALATAGSLRAWINHSRWGEIAADQRYTNSNNAQWATLTTIQPFYADDYIELLMRSNAGTRQAQIKQFAIIGITPELVS